jgi:hypothetical protein
MIVIIHVTFRRQYEKIIVKQQEVQVFRFSGFQVFRFSGFQVFKCLIFFSDLSPAKFKTRLWMSNVLEKPSSAFDEEEQEAITCPPWSVVENQSASLPRRLAPAPL